MSSNTALGSLPRPVRMSFDISLLSSHHAPMHAKPQALAAVPAASKNRMQAPSSRPAETVRGFASSFSVTSGSQEKLSNAEHLHKPQGVRSPFHGVSMGLKSVSEGLPMVTLQSDITTFPTAPHADNCYTDTPSSGWCSTLP